jgi:hypothetical protein
MNRHARIYIYIYTATPALVRTGMCGVGTWFLRRTHAQSERGDCASIPPAGLNMSVGAIDAAPAITAAFTCGLSCAAMPEARLRLGGVLCGFSPTAQARPGVGIQGRARWHSPLRCPQPRPQGRPGLQLEGQRVRIVLVPAGADLPPDAALPRLLPLVGGGGRLRPPGA